MALRIPERPERLLFRGIIGRLKIRRRSRVKLAAGTLETLEVRTLKPSIGTAQIFMGAQGRVMDDIDLALVIRIALPVASEIAQVGGCGEQPIDARQGGDLVRVLQAIEGLDHGD